MTTNTNQTNGIPVSFQGFLYGHIFLCEPYQSLQDEGVVTEYKYRAVSRFEGKEEIFYTRNAAIFWLWAIGERCLSPTYKA